MVETAKASGQDYTAIDKMNEKTFLRIAIFTSLIGILILLFIVERTELPLSKISEITSLQIDKEVRIQGLVSSVKSTQSTTMMTVSDVTSSIKVVIFSQDIQISTGDFVEVVGKVGEYQGKLEILASEIKKL